MAHARGGGPRTGERRQRGGGAVAGGRQHVFAFFLPLSFHSPFTTLPPAPFWRNKSRLGGASGIPRVPVSSTPAIPSFSVAPPRATAPNPASPRGRRGGRTPPPTTGAPACSCGRRGADRAERGFGPPMPPPLARAPPPPGPPGPLSPPEEGPGAAGVNSLSFHKVQVSL